MLTPLYLVPGRRGAGAGNLFLSGVSFGHVPYRTNRSKPGPSAKPDIQIWPLAALQVTDAGCAALAAALDSGTLPALVMLQLNDIPASAAAIDAVTEAVYS